MDRMGGSDRKSREFHRLMMTMVKKRGKRVGGTKFSGMGAPGMFKGKGGA